jgi:hypothetical protein
VTDEQPVADDIPNPPERVAHGRLAQMKFVSRSTEASKPLDGFDDPQEVQVDEGFTAHSNIHNVNMVIHKIQFAAWGRQYLSSSGIHEEGSDP